MSVDAHDRAHDEIMRAPECIPLDWRDDWHERAAVREHEGCMPRAGAEGAATADVMAMMATADGEPAEATPLDRTVIDAGHHADADGRFPEHMRPYRTPGHVRAIPAGWTPASWRDRLRTLADACEAGYPERAADLRREAAALATKGTAS